jgi:hypothetical protein
VLGLPAKEWGHLLVIGLLTLMVVFLALRWPQYKVLIWAVALTAAALYVYVEVRKPVNYRWIRVEGNRIEYDDRHDRHLIALDSVAKVEFVRDQAIFPDLYGPYLETSWWIETLDGNKVEVMDEWPDRPRLLRAFKRHLAGFDAARARQALASRSKGRWICFQR